MKNFKFCFHYQEDWRLVNINYSQICDAVAADEKTNTRCEKQKNQQNTIPVKKDTKPNQKKTTITNLT